MVEEPAFPVAEISASGLARRLRDLLAERGWKPATLASKAGLAASWIPAYLEGRVAKPRLETLRKLAAAFDMDLSEFLAGTPVESVAIALTAHEADVLRSLAAIERRTPDEVATTAVVVYLQSAYEPRVGEVLRAILKARESAGDSS